MAILALVFVLSFTGAFGVETVDSVNEAYVKLIDENNKLQEQLSTLNTLFGVLEENYFNLLAKLRKCESREDNTEDDTTCPTDFIGFRGKCYWFNMNRLDWDEAKEACRQKGAYLASIKTNWEQAFLEHQASENYRTNSTRRAYYWLGMKLSSDHTKIWSDGTPVEYDNFDEGEPQCMISGCKVAMSETVGYTWEDVTSRLDYFSICQRWSR